MTAPAAPTSAALPLVLPLTGTQFEIAAGEYQATVTQLGAGLRTLASGGRPLITGYEPDELPPHGSGQLLAPWPNRVDHGSYAFGGGSYQLDLSEPARGNAIHGLTRWLSWQPVTHSAGHVELALDLLGQGGYPFCLRLRARYELSATAGLTVTVSARNQGTRPAPFGTGSHPYLVAGPAGIDDWQLEVHAARYQPCDDRGIPAGQPHDVGGTDLDFRTARPIGGTALDTPFTHLAADADGRAWVHLTGPDARLALWAGPGYSWLQVFTGDTLGPGERRRAVAIEPMTCPPNAFVTGTDLIVLAPGEAVAQSWGIQAAQL